MPRPRSFRTLVPIALSIASILLVACEGITVATPQPGQETPATGGDVPGRATPIPTQARPTATPPQRVDSSPVPGSTATARSTSTSSPSAGVATTATGIPTGSTGGPRSQIASIDEQFDKFEGSTLVGQDGFQLGVIRPATEAFNSICDNVLDGGAAFGANSVLNDLSNYGGPFGTNSPFNSESIAPPQILTDGVAVGHLTLSPSFVDAVDPVALVAWLGCPVDSS